MAEEKDWNKIFAERKAQRDRERAEKLARAKLAAASTRKEPFSRRRFKQLYARLNPDDVDARTPWETLLAEAEYDYYVTHAELATLEALVQHMRWLEGWG